MIELTNEYLASQGLSKTFPDRFWKKVKRTKGCWFWIGCLTRGYGYIGKRGHRGLIRAHRASWIITKGPIPENKPFVLHNCPGGDCTSCVNPDHLWVGAQKENLEDMAKKGRSTYGERQHNVRLTTKDVKEIRRKYIRNIYGYVRLSRDYNVSYNAILCVVRRKTWRHI